jgi:hypothetical protein
MDRVMLVGDVVLVVGAVAGSPVLVVAGFALVAIGFGRVLVKRRARRR